jgi:hypothetical protein
MESESRDIGKGANSGNKQPLRIPETTLAKPRRLMAPNDQYLCIVPKQTTACHDRVFLPFEGDGTLSVVLSKAFMLADDMHITDPTITSQLHNKP